MNKRSSLKDIAKEAGVSIATVSYVLSKNLKSGISQEVSDRIKKIAKDLNYRPNQIAQSLQSGKSHSIGLIVADISNPFFSQIARIIEDEAKSYGYTVIFGSSDEKTAKSKDLIKFLLNRQVDGLIITPTEGSEDQIKLLIKHNIPFVLIDRYFPSIETNFVSIDNFLAGFQATKRLLLNGSERIGMIAYDTGLQHMKERIDGYREALSTEKIDDELVLFVKYSETQLAVAEAIDKMLGLKRPVDAIFFATNTLGILGLKHLNQLDKKIPKDLSVIVFDESEIYDFFYCPLTYIKQPLNELAKAAVKALTEHINNPKAKLNQIKLRADLIIGESCN